MTTRTKWEAVKFETFEHDGATKTRRIHVGNVIAHDNGKFTVFIPREISVTGELLIQPQRQTQESENQTQN